MLTFFFELFPGCGTDGLKILSSPVMSELPVKLFSHSLFAVISSLFVIKYTSRSSHSPDGRSGTIENFQSSLMFQDTIDKRS